VLSDWIPEGETIQPGDGNNRNNERNLRMIERARAASPRFFFVGFFVSGVAMRSEIGTPTAMKHLFRTLLLLSLATVFCGCGGEKKREAQRLAAIEERKAEEAAAAIAAEREKQQRRQQKILELEAGFELERPQVAKQIVVRLHAPGEMFHARADSIKQKLVSMFNPLFPGVEVVPYSPMSGPVSHFALGVIDVTAQGSWATYGPHASPTTFNGVGCVIKSMAMQVYYPPELAMAKTNGVLVVAATELPGELTEQQMLNLHPQRMKQLESDCLAKLAATLQEVDKAAIDKALAAVKPLEPQATEGYAVVFDPLPDSYARTEIMNALEKRLGRGRVFLRGQPGKTELGTVTVNFKQLGRIYKTPGGEDAGVNIPEEAELRVVAATAGGDPGNNFDLTFKAELNAPETMHFQNMKEVAFFQMHALLQELARKMGAG